MDDKHYMKLALNLAEEGRGHVNPNPMVGAVIVKDGQMIGSGYHMKYGGPHAERNALASCCKSPEGATLYVTLEPCCHHGKTPPCTDAIIENKISRVVVGAGDPNPLVAGKGIEILREKGIQVDIGMLEAECREQNEIFFYQIQNRKPFVAIKYAMTLDGKIATFSGESRWITGEEAREHAHGLRRKYSAILVGIGTLLTDDPMLNCRQEGGRDPIRVICDTNLRIPMGSRVVRTAGEIPTYIAHTGGEEEKGRQLQESGCHVIRLNVKEPRVDLQELMEALYQKGVDSVLIEGGSAIHFSALSSGIVNRIYAYIGPKILGGESSKSPVGGRGIGKIAEAIPLRRRDLGILGDDILLEYDVAADFASLVSP